MHYPKYDQNEKWTHIHSLWNVLSKITSSEILHTVPPAAYCQSTSRLQEERNCHNRSDFALSLTATHCKMRFYMALYYILFLKTYLQKP